ncbi:MAG: molybdopterin molybdotransferase MoeA [Acidimicrobiales bacterium]
MSIRWGGEGGEPRSVEQHQADAVGLARPLARVELPLLDALGTALCDDVVAPWSLPSFDNSAMDGYALRSEDVRVAGNSDAVCLKVVGDVAAGRAGGASSGTVESGSCVRIMTGAPIPLGADAVVPVEWTDAGMDHVTVTMPCESGSNIRRAGEDVAAGDVVLRAGTRVGPSQVALLASVGMGRVGVHRRPRVAVVSTGSELVEPGGQIHRGEIADANSLALASAVSASGAEAIRLEHLPDDPIEVFEALRRLAAEADVIVTSGGVSMGAFDVVKQAFASYDGVRFVRVAMRPGMPQAIGMLGDDRDVLYFGLPGNPVSARVSFELFVLPAIRTMLGYSSVFRPFVAARAASDLRSSPGKIEYLRGRLDVGVDPAVFVPVGGRGSHLIAGMAGANALGVVPEHKVSVAAGARIMVLPLSGEEWG